MERHWSGIDAVSKNRVMMKIKQDADGQKAVRELCEVMART